MVARARLEEPADLLRFRTLVEAALGPGALERLETRTSEGLRLRPLYGPWDAPPAFPEALRSRPSFDADRAWDIRAPIDVADPADANHLALAELEGGASSLLLCFDPDRAAGREDFERLLEGVYLDLAPIELDAGLAGPDLARLLAAAAEARTLRPRLEWGLDPLSALARQGGCAGPQDPRLKEAARAALLPCERAFLASGRFVHEAGGGPALEIAAAAAAGITYLKSLDEEGLRPQEGLRTIALALAADDEYFAVAAKIRALRLVWARIAASLGAHPEPAPIHARSSRRMLARLDPFVNMVRLTTAAFGAAVGGADVLVLEPFTQPVGASTPLARRQARNTQLILMQEARIGDVADPAGGAFFIEALTRALAASAWEQLQSIEREGGLPVALASGALAERLSEQCAARRAEIAAFDRGIVGVSLFPAPLDLTSAAGTRHPGSGAGDGPGPFAPVRDAAPFEALRERAAALGAAEVPILVLGDSRAAADRLAFARTALAAGGLTARLVTEDDLDPPPSLLLVGGSRDALGGDAEARLDALRRAGVRQLYLLAPPEELPGLEVSARLYRGGAALGAVDHMIASLRGAA